MSVIKNSAMNENTKPIMHQDPCYIGNSKSSLKIPIKPSEEFNGVRITPASVCFFNIYESYTVEKTFEVINISNRSVFVKISDPTSLAFKLDSKTRRVCLAPGLAVTRKVKFVSMKHISALSWIPITVGDSIFQYPIHVVEAKSKLESSPTKLNFDVVNVASSAVSRKLKLKNCGDGGCTFNVDVGFDDISVIVSPMKGNLSKNDSVSLTIELASRAKGKFVKEFWIRSSNAYALRVPLKVDVIVPQLRAIHPGTIGKFTIVNFEPTFCGTQRYSCIILYNDSATNTMFATLVDNEPARVLCDMKHAVFVIEPSEGYMESREGQIISIYFRPRRDDASERTCKRLKNELKEEECLKFATVFSIENRRTRPVVVNVSGASKQSNEGYNYLKNRLEAGETSTTKITDPLCQLCLYGISVKPVIKTIPDKIEFGLVLVGEEKVRVLRLSNPCSLPIHFKYKKIPNVFVAPIQGCVLPGEETEIAIKLIPTRICCENTSLTFEMLSPYCLSSIRSEFVVIGDFSINVTFTVPAKSEKSIKQNKELPVVAKNDSKISETGMFADMTFKMLPTYTEMMNALEKENRKIIQNEDRSSWLGIEADRFTKSKFTCIKDVGEVSAALKIANTSRNRPYSFDPNLKNTPSEDRRFAYTAEEREAKKLHDKKYIEYMRSTAKTEVFHVEYTRGGTKIEIPLTAQPLDSYRCKLRKQDPTGLLPLPLSPHVLHNIQIYPHITDFGQVSRFSNSRHIVTISNKNKVPVKLTVQPRTSDIQVCGENTREIPPVTSVQIEIDYTSGDIGKYNGFIEYIVNDHHSFEVPVIVEVITKPLVFNPDEITFGTCVEKAFPINFYFVKLKNLTQSSSSFSWNLPKKSSFSITPKIGEVPPGRSLICTLCYEPDIGRSLVSDIILQSNDIPLQILKCKAILNKPRAFFLESKICMNDVPLNIERKSKAMLYNSSFEDVLYTVSNPYPLPSCKIFPVCGVIKARSILFLTISVKIDAAINFAFSVSVVLQDQVTAKLQVIGNAGFPEVTINPAFVRFNKIRAGSFDSVCLTAKNVGKVSAHVAFNMKDFPEYTPSPIRSGMGDLDFGSPPGFTLDVGEKVSFYLHFKPLEVAEYEFLLPVVLNGIVGPPVLKEEQSQKSRYYLDPLKKKFEGTATFNENDIPEKLPCVKVCGTVSAHILLISKIHFDFTFNPVNPSLSRNKENLAIGNTSHEEVTLAIHTSDLHALPAPFHLQCDQRDKNRQEEDSSVTFTLAPGEKISLEIIFEPNSPGVYVREAAVFVRGNDTVFNYLYFKGTYPEPTLVCSKAEIYFSPVPLNVECESRCYLIALNYPARSKVSYDVKFQHSSMGEPTSSVLSITLPIVADDIEVNQEGHYIPVSIKFTGSVRVSFRAEVLFTDDVFGAKCSMFVIAAAENCVLSTHTYLYTKAKQYRIEEPSESENNKLDKYEDETREKEKRSNRGEHPSHLESFKYSDQRRRTLMTDYLESRDDVLNIEGFINSNIDFREISSNISEFSYPTDRRMQKCLSGESSPFPKFPLNCDSSYAEHMKRTLSAAETWLFEQGFRCTYSASLPEGMSNIFNGSTHRPRRHSEESKSPFKLQTVVDLLKNFAGPQILDWFSPNPMPLEKISRVSHVYSMHITLINYLSAHGACLDHVQPKYLLSYEDYVVCKTNKLGVENACTENTATNVSNNTKDSCTDENLSSEDYFRSLSTQAWLDIILQIYKIFVLSKITRETFLDSKRWPSASFVPYTCSDTIISVLRELHQKVTQKHKQVDPLEQSDVYSASELILLNWLQAHSHSQKELVSERDVRNFDSDLEDGLVLISVTAAYCPYLVDSYFHDLYTNPSTEEQKLHNVARLTDAWRSLGIGFTITPREIVWPNAVQMIMLVAHLYDNLPSLYPHAIIGFDTPLNTELTRKIELINPTKQSVDFYIHVLGNSSANFQCDSIDKVVHIPKLGKAVLTLKYRAHKMSLSRATLIISGSAVPPTFCRNLAFTLEGAATDLRVSSTIKLRVHLYVPTRCNFKIKPPSNVPATYDIFITGEEPVSIENCRAIPWKEASKKFPHPMYLHQSQLKFEPAECAAASLDATVTCLAKKNYYYWLVFLNSEVGDFIVKLQISLDESFTCTSLTAALPVDLQNLKCTCNVNGGKCPLLLVLPIPCRNWELLKAIREMFDLMAGTDERGFFCRSVEVNVMLTLLKCVLQMTGDERNLLELQHVFNYAVTYNVKCCHPEYITAPPQFKIEDVRRPELIPCVVHLTPDIPGNFETTFTFTSQDEMERRKYNVALNKS